MYGHLLANVLNVLFAILCLVFPITITFFYPGVLMDTGAIMLGLTLQWNNIPSRGDVVLSLIEPGSKLSPDDMPLGLTL